MEGVTNDIFKYEVLNHCNIASLMKMRALNTKYYNMITIDYIKKRIIKNIEDRLAKIFGFSWQPFQEQLKKSQAIISGSFIIQCILDEDWNTDLDIYVPSTLTRETLRQMHNGAKKIEGKISHIETWLFNHNFINTRYQGSDRYNEGISSDIRCVRNYGFCDPDQLEEYKNASPYDKYANNSRFVDPNKPQIQIIQVNQAPEDIPGFIQDHFDLDICKNIYGIRESQSHLHITSLNQIISKQNCTGFGYNSKLTLARYKKYINHGFTFSDISLEQYQEFLARPEDFYLFSIKERVPPTSHLFKEFKLIKGHEYVFTPKRSCSAFAINGVDISFRPESLISHTSCDICTLIANTFNFKRFYHFNVTSMLKSSTPVEFIFAVSESYS